ncbi:MAG: outer membrane beta-barrel protein [Casimicrobiaceae bacterium]
MTPKRMRDLCTFSFGAACALAAGAATAAPPAGAFYVGVSGGASHFDQDYGSAVRDAYAGSVFTVTDAGMTDKSGSVWGVYGGWQFHPNFAVEAGWVDLGKARAAYTLARQGTFTRTAEYEVSGPRVTLVASAPVGSAGFEVIGKAGVVFTTLEYRETGSDRGDPYSFTAGDERQTRFSAGLGGRYAFDPRFAVRIDWDRTFDVGQKFALNTTGNGRFESIDAFTASLEYRF